MLFRDNLIVAGKSQRIESAIARCTCGRLGQFLLSYLVGRLAPDQSQRRDKHD